MAPLTTFRRDEPHTKLVKSSARPSMIVSHHKQGCDYADEMKQ